MLKFKSLINVFWVMTILFCCHSIDSSTAYAFNSPNGNENVIVDQCPREDSGQSSGGVSTISADHNRTDNWFSKIQFDPSNPDEIDRNDAITIKIIGGCSRYTWSVSGNGFSLAESQTTGLSNTLIANDTACGAATIQVTGCSGGTPATGYVRCTTGTWDLQPWSCPIPGPATEGVSLNLTRVEGKYKVNQYFYMCNTPAGSCTEVNCSEICTPPSCIDNFCQEFFGTEFCPSNCCTYTGHDCNDTYYKYGCFSVESSFLYEWTCP